MSFKDCSQPHLDKTDITQTADNIKRECDVWLAQRSLLLLSGEARWGWSHGIAHRKSDIPGLAGGPIAYNTDASDDRLCTGQTAERGWVLRKLRYSLTFRNVRQPGEKCSCAYPNCCDSRMSQATISKSPENGRFNASIGTATNQVCRNWNAGRCTFGSACPRQHICSLCASDEHTVADCDFTTNS